MRFILIIPVTLNFRNAMAIVRIVVEAIFSCCSRRAICVYLLISDFFVIVNRENCIIPKTQYILVEHILN